MTEVAPAPVDGVEGNTNRAYNSTFDDTIIDTSQEGDRNPIPKTQLCAQNAYAVNGDGKNGNKQTDNNAKTQDVLSFHASNNPQTTPYAEKGISVESSDDDKNEKKKGFFSFLPFNKNKESKPKPQMIPMSALFRFADTYDKIFMFLGVCSAAAHGVAMPILLVIFGKLTETFVQNGNATTNQTTPSFLNDGFLDEIRTYCVYFVADGIVVIFVAYGQVMFWLTTSYRQSNRIRLALLRAVLRQDIGWFDTHDAGEIGSRLTDDVNKIQEGIGDKIGAFVQWMSTFVSGLIIGLVSGWKLALVIIAVSPLIAVFGGLMMHMLTLSSAKESLAYAKAGAIADEVLSSMRTVVAFGGQEKECVRYSSNLYEAKAYGIRKAMVSGGGMGLTFLTIFCTYALAFWYGGLLIRTDTTHYNVGVMLITFFCVVFGAMALGNAAPSLQVIAAARGVAFTIWDIIDRVPPIDSSSDAGTFPSSLVGHIEVKDVEFIYPSRPETQILRGLTLEIRPGQTVALVGSSGCGKSTVIQLLQRFYNLQKGSITIDGTDITELNVKWLRRHIGVVSQEPILFGTTIAENIRYGRDGVTQAEIEQATKEANAFDFISNLPMKFETLVGERGAQLSGGQKQRIAIARALVRDPKILLLDEATSALDTESEATVQAALDNARQGRTTIVVAHRLSTIRTADIIYGIKDGVVHECGTHDELMKRQGIYYQLVMNQQVMEEEKESQDSDSENEEDAVESKLKRTTSRNSNRSLRRGLSNVDPSATAIAKKNEKLPEVSMMRVMAMNKQEWYLIVIGCIMALAHGGLQPIFGLIFGSVLGVFVKSPQEQEEGIFFYAMMFIVLGAGTGISMFVQGWMFGISGEELTLRMRQLTFKALLRQEIAYFDNPDNPVGALTTRLATDASAVQGATGYRLGMALQAVGSLAVGIVIGFVFSWKFALFILGVMPFILVSAVVQMKLAKGFAGKNNEALEGAGKIATEAITNIRTIASLTKEEAFLNAYIGETDPPYRGNLRSAHMFGATFCILQSMIFFAYAAIFYFGAWLIVYDGLDYSSMFKVFISIIFGAISVGRESQFGPDYGKAKVAASRIFQLFDRNPGKMDSYSTEGTKPVICLGTVEFKDVQFSYPTRPTVKVLKGLNLQVKQGHTIALVGSSGCGKSTTVQLLQRFYDAASGNVCIDGHDITSLNVAWLRAQIGLVSQEPVLFDYSLRENIAYGDNSRTPTMDEIIQAAREANIHNFIQTLPNGYETSAGDKGTQLSGGQKQRIAIARALLRNPKILLLDEATSALDTESEKIVQDALDRAQQGRTSLVIAHRLSTIQNAHCIVVFQNGRVAERGTHTELMSQKGLYYKLNVTQGNRK